MSFSGSAFPADLSAADDTTLARALVERHPRAPRAVFDRFGPLVRRIVRRSFNADGDAEDAAQEVFASLFENAHRLREPSALRAYVAAIAARRGLLHGRRRRMEARLAQSEAHEVADDCVSESNADSRRALLQFCRILDQVGSRDRAAYVLRYIEGKDAIDVARALEISVSTARRRFLRARRRVSRLAGRDPSLTEYLSRSSA